MLYWYKNAITGTKIQILSEGAAKGDYDSKVFFLYINPFINKLIPSVAHVAEEQYLYFCTSVVKQVN
jgi:hypothetical protein